MFWVKNVTFFTNQDGSIHFTAVKHEKDVVQVATRCLPGHEFKFFIQELGCSQSQSNVHHLCPERNMQNEMLLTFSISDSSLRRPDRARLKASSMICTRLINGISWKEMSFHWRNTPDNLSMVYGHCLYLRVGGQPCKQTFPVIRVVVDPVEALHVDVGQHPVIGVKHHVRICLWNMAHIFTHVFHPLQCS